jgi:hypothetical protein
MKSKLLKVAAVIVALFVAMGRESATGRDWNDPFGGPFLDPGNWSPTGVPNQFETAFFNLNSGYTVSFPSSQVEIGELFVHLGDVTFEFAPGGSLNLPTGSVVIGPLPTPIRPNVSLTMSGGSMIAQNAITILPGGTLGGNGFVGATLIEVQENANLTGTLLLGGAIHNSGRIAPGQSTTGIILIDGTYFQMSSGNLEIEVGGTTPGTQHDQLQVAGSAELAGKLTVPFIGYSPSISHTMLVLTADSITGRFDSLSFPDLNGSVAAQVTYTPTTATIGFVNATARSFNSNALVTPPLPNYWNKSSLWGSGLVPNSTNTVNMFSTQSSPQQVELNSQVAGAESAIVHQITVGGSTNTMKLLVPENTNFTAVKQMTVGNMGILEIDDGTVHSNQVVISPGGVLQGTGTIEGNLVLGNNTGNNSAVLRPGFSPGTINVNGDLTVGDNGLMVLEIDSPTSFDTVIVTQDADLDGTARIDVTGVDISTIENLSFSLLTAADVDNEFQTVQTIGTPDHFFAAEYTEVAAFFSLYEEGDMQRDDDLDADDVMAFAEALKDPDGYEDDYGISGDYSGDINDDGILDFDDIVPFANIHGIGLTAEEITTIIANFAPVPEPASTTLMGLALSLASFRRISRRTTTSRG